MSKSVRKPSLRRLSLLLFAATLPAVGQVKSGTIIVVAESQAKVVVAADSRVTRASGPPEDGYCKITMLNPKLVFAAAGVIQDTSPDLAPGLRFLAADVAKEVNRDFKPDDAFPDHSTVWQKAQRWGDIMSFRLRQGIPQRLHIWLHGQQEKSMARFVEGIFAGVEPDGKLSVVVSIVDYAPPIKGLRTPLARPYLEIPGLLDNATWIEPYGMPQVAWDYIHGSSEYSKELHVARLGPPDKFDEHIPIVLVEKTIAEDRSPEPKGVGGSVDAVRLLPNKGAEWIIHPNCPDGARSSTVKRRAEFLAALPDYDPSEALRMARLIAIDAPEMRPKL